MPDPATQPAHSVAPDASRSADRSLVAYVLLWFPLSSETFIFREIRQLIDSGLNIRVFTLYGRALKDCSEEMKAYDQPVQRFGTKSTLAICRAFTRMALQKPRLVANLLKRGLFRRMRNFESLGENAWAFFAGFLLAEECRKNKTSLIHASWANGPATAAWVASRITGIPFAFTGRAGDIYPQDGILDEKARDAIFIRTNNAANVSWLRTFCPPEARDKVHLVYNSFFFNARKHEDKELPAPPYRVLAVGRFVRTKGFPYLLTAMARLKRENFPVLLTIVGDGAWRRKLIRQTHRLGLENQVSMPGFMPNDLLAEVMSCHDLLVVPSVVHGNGDRDGIPNVIMEALSLDMPVVATDVCGISEVIENGKTGCLIPQRDPAAIANAIRKALENWAATKNMARAGHERVLQMFDPQKNGAALMELYENASRGLHA